MNKRMQDMYIFHAKSISFLSCRPRRYNAWELYILNFTRQKNTAGILLSYDNTMSHGTLELFPLQYLYVRWLEHNNATWFDCFCLHLNAIWNESLHLQWNLIVLRPRFPPQKATQGLVTDFYFPFLVVMLPFFFMYFLNGDNGERIVLLVVSTGIACCFPFGNNGERVVLLVVSTRACCFPFGNNGERVVYLVVSTRIACCCPFRNNG